MKLILLAFLLISVSTKTVEEINLLADPTFDNAKITLDNRVKNYCQTKSYPKNYQSYISSWSSVKVEYIFDYMTINTLDQNLPSKHFPKEVEAEIKAAKYLSTSSADSKIKYNIYKTSTEIDDYIGAAMKWKEYILFGVIHSKISASLVPLFNKVGHQVCQRKWYCLWICKKCHTEYSYVSRAYTYSELNTVKEALAAKSAQEMINKINHF